MLCQDTVDIPFQEPFTVAGHCSDMRIRELDDTVAIESCRQVFTAELDMTDFQLFITYEHAVEGKEDDNQGDTDADFLTPTTRHEITTQEENHQRCYDKGDYHEKRYCVTSDHF